MEKRKIWIAAAIGVIAVLVIAILIINRNEGKVKLFSGTDYPCVYWQEGDSVLFRLQDGQNGDLPWQVLEENGIVESAVKGEVKGEKVTYALSPKSPGMTEVRLYKTREMSGFEAEIVSVTIPVEIAENESGLTLRVYGSPSLADQGGGIGGKGTDYPYMLLNNRNGTAKICFVSGGNDWKVSDRTNMAGMDWTVGDGDADVCWIYENPEYDPDAEPVTELATEADEAVYRDEEASTEDGTELNSDPVKPAKSAEDVSEVDIPDGEDWDGVIDMSDYLVDGEIPEDVLKALEKKMEVREREQVMASSGASEEDAAGDAAGTAANAAYDRTREKILETLDPKLAKQQGEAEDASGINSTLDYSGLYEIDDPAASVTTESVEDMILAASGAADRMGDSSGMTDREAQAVVVKETILTVSSEQYHVTEYIRVRFMSDGRVLLSVSKKGPKK